MSGDSEGSQCEAIMCKEGIYNKKDAAKWLLAHHPDKAGKPSSVNVGQIATCMKDKDFCKAVANNTRKTNNKNKGSSQGKNNNSNTAKRRRSSIERVFKRVRQSSLSRGNNPDVKPEAAYKKNGRQLECVRQVSNWSKITPANRFDKSRFKIKETDKLIPIASPKIEAMLQNIKALDDNDMMLYGKKFKHFIFSDIKAMGYGAKIISAAFIARNFHSVLKFEKSKIVVDVPKLGGENFAVLCSTALWDSPFNQKLKKAILDMFNKRPDNIHGENCRFIILDSGFKEGIDLFDVRYVHLFEPLMTDADLTQALGRATRLCGQKGLDFVPNQGWPLNVYKYSHSIPEQLQGVLKAKNLFDITLQLKGVDTRLHSITKAIRDVSILAAVDQPITEEIHKSGIMPRLIIKKTSVSTGHNANIRMEMIKNTINISNELTRANLVKKSPVFAIEDLTQDSLGALKAIEDVEELKAIEAVASAEAKSPCTDCLSAAIVPFKPSRLSEKEITPVLTMESNVLVVIPPTASASASASSASSSAEDKQPKTWFELRRYILKQFGNMAWPVQKVVNKCIDKPEQKRPEVKVNKDYIVPPKQKILPKLNLVDYTPTQDFISNYFTIASPVKGMLLWHSVGTGKTCSAIALASSQFEPAGYTIIWVTRHTLKADIWKNIFDQVCHISIAKEVKEGKLAPEQAEKRQKQMAKQWIPPMSYRQFSNIVQGKNALYKLLKDRNGRADPLKKTLIIIDEAHKLYSSDFKGAEKPDVPAFMAALQNSYKESGAESARVLLMTATPYNESPMELMSLLNLCRPKADALPTEIPDFVKKYMDATGNFSKEGLHTYMNDIAGQISYLNRESDPSQFAQPIFADIIVPISTYDSVDSEGSNELLEAKKELAELLDEKTKLEDEVIPHLQEQIKLFGPALEAKLLECQQKFGGKPKDLKDCSNRVTKKYKEGLKLEESNLKMSIKRVTVIEKDFIKLEKKAKKMTVKLRKTGLSSLTQQAQLETRCKIGI